MTEDKLDKRTRELVKILELKEENNKAEFERKERILKSNFGQTVNKLIRKVKL